MSDAADKIMRLLAVIFIIAPAVSGAAVCYRSAAGARIPGMSGESSITILWSENGESMEGIRVAGQGKQVRADMMCTEDPPISCRLGRDGGRIGLVFDQNRVKVITSGLQVTVDEGRRARLSVRRARMTIAHDLYQISADECRQAFPDQNAIVVFPAEQVVPAIR